MTTLEWYVPTPTTLERTLIAGEVAGVGSKGCYRRLQFGAGEPRLVRDELSCRSSTGGSQRRSLVVLAQITDLQLADAQSPGRFEFFEYLRGRPDMQAFVPAYRPQEVLNVHAVDAIAAAIRNYGGSPETGARVGLVLSTGDNVDNAAAERADLVPVAHGGRKRRGLLGRPRLRRRPGARLAR